MQLTNLITKNFKKLGNREFNFTQGANFILGENGTGKSTVLRAVATALFGVQMLPGVADDIATRGQGNWSVELAFNFQGSLYTVTRTKSTARVNCGEKLLASGHTPVTKYIEDLLQVAAKDYNLLFHSRQGETNYILTYGATALQRKVEEFSGAQQLDTILVKLNANSNKAQAEHEAIHRPTVEEMQELEQSIATTEQALAEQEKSLRAVELGTEPVQPAITVAEVYKKVQTHKNWEQLEVQRINALGETNLALAQIPALEEVPAVIDLTPIQEAIAEIDKFNNQQELAVRLKGQVESKLAKLQVVAAPTAVEIDVEPILETLENLRASFAEKQKAVRKNKDTLSSGVCGECKTPLSLTVEDIERINAEQVELAEAIERVNAEIAEQVRVLDKGRANNKALVVQTNAFNAYKSQLEALEGEKLALVEPQPLKDKSALEGQLMTSVAMNAKIAGIEQANLDKTNLRAQLEAKVQQLSVAQPEPEVVTELQVTAVEQEWADYQAAKAKLERDQLHVSSIKNLILTHERMLGSMVMQRVQWKNNEETYSLLGKTVDNYRMLIKFIRERRESYLSQVWDAITVEASNFLQRATKDWITEIVIKDGKFFFTENGHQMPSVEASGAQEAFLGVALRVGLNKALYRRQAFMMFDEPTDGMRESNARHLVGELTDVAQQCFIITHRESDQALADNILEV